MLKKRFDWKFQIEEVILLMIIVLNIFDAAETLPATLDYVKKIISWAGLGIIFYKAKPTQIIFGVRQKAFEDVLLIAGYFLILIKDLVSYAMSSITETSSFLVPFFNVLINNAYQIEIFGIFTGLFLIIAVSINMILKHPIKGPSIMEIIHEEGSIPQNFKELTRKVLTSTAVLLAFFLIVFNLVMEWLAIAIDAPLLMIAIAFYLFFIVKHHKKVFSKKFLIKFGDFGSKFYEDIIEHFKYKKTILRALFAMLVLHIATEALHFIWPYLFGVADSLYFNLLSTAHPSFYSLFVTDALVVDFFSSILLFIAYIGNLAAILFFLIAPGYLWFLIYKNKKFALSKIQITLLVSSISIFILSPAFQISLLWSQLISGVDIIGQSILQNSLFPIEVTVLISVCFGLFASLISRKKHVEMNIMKIITILSQSFFVFYITLFTISISQYYVNTLIYLASISKFFLMFIFAIFFIITLLFYILGTFSFVRDTHAHSKEHLTVK